MAIAKSEKALRSQQAVQAFEETVRAVWGDPIKVAEATLNEVYRLGDVEHMECATRVQYALRIGVGAGMLAVKSTPEEFIKFFNESFFGV